MSDRFSSEGGSEETVPLNVMVEQLKDSSSTMSDQSSSDGGSKETVLLDVMVEKLKDFSERLSDLRSLMLTELELVNQRLNALTCVMYPNEFPEFCDTARVWHFIEPSLEQTLSRAERSALDKLANIMLEHEEECLRQMGGRIKRRVRSGGGFDSTAVLQAVRVVREELRRDARYEPARAILRAESGTWQYCWALRAQGGKGKDKSTD